LELARSSALVAPQPRQAMLLPEDERPTQLALTIPEGEQDDFWREAETRLLSALAQYAADTEARDSRAAQGWLFADDAAVGVAFIDVIRRRFSVVLMTPPFGETSIRSKPYIDAAYPRSKNNLLAAFVERGVDFLEVRGLLGAITSRTGFFLPSFKRWREEV